MIASRKALIVVAALIAVLLGLPWGGAVPAALAQTISVTSANPPSGDQGTMGLSVAIAGKGFKNGAKAQFFLTGTTNPAGVNVKSTKYVSATQIVATIDIADTAALAQLDIQVQNTDGRTGKGTELFSVTARKIDPCTQPDAVPTPGWYTSGSSEVPGALDSTFGSNTGKVVGPRYLRVGFLEGSAIAIQTDGKIVAVGIRQDDCVSNAPRTWGIVRYTPDGSLDSSFGLGGLVTVAFAGGASTAQAVVVQPVDGKIVIVGSAQPSKKGSDHNQPVVVRLNTNGTLDGTFGSGGIALASAGSGGTLYSVALQSDGKIVAAGITAVSGASWGLVSRLTAAGALDTTFNGSGTYISSASGIFAAVTTQVVGAQECIVVAGFARDSPNHPIGAVWRFDASGHLDPGFGGSGMVTTSFHDIEDGLYHEDAFRAVAVDSSGRIVAAGYTSTNSEQQSNFMEYNVALARYSSAGTLDTEFGSNGRVWASSSAVSNVGLLLAIQPADQKIVVAGYSTSNDFDAAGNAVDDMAGLWRFDADGTVDTGFGRGGGWVLDPIISGSIHAAWKGMALHDGKIVCGGEVWANGTAVFGYAAIARFWQ
jgi:uncharacterized delta-60 repeat protein